MKLRIRESDMKYNTYGNWKKAYDVLVGEKGYTPDEAQEIISNIQKDYKYNPNSNDSIMRRIKQVLPKDEYEKEYRIKDTFGESKLREQDVEIEVKNKGILEVPEDKNVDDLPMSHFEKLVKKHGLSKITKALNNLQVWNKNDDNELSKWAGNMIDKLTKKYGKNESISGHSFNEGWHNGDAIITFTHNDDLEADLEEFLFDLFSDNPDVFDFDWSGRDTNLYLSCSKDDYDYIKWFIEDWKYKHRDEYDESLKEYYDAQDFNSGIEDMFNYDGGDMYDDIPDEAVDTKSKAYFDFVVNDVMTRCKDEREARRYMRAKGLPKSFIDVIIKEIDRIYD